MSERFESYEQIHDEQAGLDALAAIRAADAAADAAAAVDNTPDAAAADAVADAVVDATPAAEPVAQSVAQPQGMSDAQWQKLLNEQNAKFEKMLAQFAPKPVAEPPKPDATLARIQKLRERGEDELADELLESYQERMALRQQLSAHTTAIQQVETQREIQALESTIDAVQRANPTFDRQGFITHLGNMDSRLLNSKDFTQHAKDFHTQQTAYLTANRDAILRHYGLDPATATPAQVQAAAAGAQSAGGASPSQGAVASKFPVRGAGAASAVPPAKPDPDTPEGRVAILQQIRARGL